MSLRITAAICTIGLFVAQNAAFGQSLPAEVEAARSEVLRIAAENTLRTDNIREIRQRLTPHIITMAVWFMDNRPANELELTQVPWRSIWYDDPDIEFASLLQFGDVTIRQKREKIYQVVQDGFYYNVGESEISFGDATIAIQTFLKGAYTVLRPAVTGTEGGFALNTVDLEFVANSIRIGPLQDGIPLVPLVALVDSEQLPTIQIPGPLGVTGQLWNVYVDEELRVSIGFDDAAPEVIDIYILRRVSRVGG